MLTCMFVDDTELHFSHGDLLIALDQALQADIQLLIN